MLTYKERPTPKGWGNLAGTKANWGIDQQAICIHFILTKATTSFIRVVCGIRIILADFVAFYLTQLKLDCQQENHLGNSRWGEFHKTALMQDSPESRISSSNGNLVPDVMINS